MLRDMDEHAARADVGRANRDVLAASFINDVQPPVGCVPVELSSGYSMWLGLFGFGAHAGAPSVRLRAMGAATWRVPAPQYGQNRKAGARARPQLRQRTVTALSNGTTRRTSSIVVMPCFTFS